MIDNSIPSYLFGLFSNRILVNIPKESGFLNKKAINESLDLINEYLLKNKTIPNYKMEDISKRVFRCCEDEKGDYKELNFYSSRSIYYLLRIIYTLNSKELGDFLPINIKDFYNSMYICEYKLFLSK